ncbi:hypothetical protein BHM03_00041026 [Ensete ventricosum]|uniref:Uncharacterized protein n=1 Tax=Ensete ventricosum TaxID=4639 RepID=A0A426ZAZ8_ENSVE|nr:hypothetical protein B296_00023534 [Ensete ventricosum]RZS09894.1 hypothetical protein BHM03_00041026 [Ensete ventricosum]
MLGQQEHFIKTSHGTVSVSVFGDQDKPALITYPDVALNRKCDVNKMASLIQNLQVTFSYEVCGSSQIPESEIVQACRSVSIPLFSIQLNPLFSYPDQCYLVQVQACGSLVTEEQPHAMLIPLEYFFMGYGFYRLNQFTDSPRGPLSPSCISPELLSPESLGVKLKPIKTRVSIG